VNGAKAMLSDGCLFTRFPESIFALAIHDAQSLPAGQVGFTSGYATASNNFVDITIFGKGGRARFCSVSLTQVVIGARLYLL